MTQLAEQLQGHSENFARFTAQLKSTDPAWHTELRQAGFGRFHTVGFPSNQQEEWRFTNINPILRTSFGLAERAKDAEIKSAVAAFGFGSAVNTELVFVNGHFAPEHSRFEGFPKNARVGNLADMISQDGAIAEKYLGQYADLERNPFVALNTGFIQDGAFLHLPKGSSLGTIHLLFVSVASARPVVSHPRVLIIAEDNVEASIVETYAGRSGMYFTNAVTEIVLGKDCRIDHNKLNQESRESFHIATMHVELGSKSRFISHSSTIGSKITRNDLIAVMAGDGADATLNGLVILSGDQHCDNHTVLDHAKPNCPSHEIYKHVLSDRASGVFKGKILVRKDAQKTDSKQTSKSLLLSDDSQMNSQPALEIYADDVKCTHGSTTGPVDDDMIFYLRSRGVSLDAARHLLTYAFAADVTRRIKIEPVRARLEDFMASQHGLPQDLRITDLGQHDQKAL